MKIKKIIAKTVLLLLSFLLITGCSIKRVEDLAYSSGDSSVIEPIKDIDPILFALQENIRERGDTIGIAYLGFVDLEDTENDLKDGLENSSHAEVYPFLCDFSNGSIVAYEGFELYALVPRDSDSVITVYASDMTQSGEYEDYKDSPLYRGKPGEVLVLRCNVSENYSNVLISAEGESGLLEFHPMLSMMDGHLALEDGCFDFSLYGEINQPDYSIEIAYEMLLETAEIQNYIEQGMTLSYTGERQTVDGRDCLLFALGTDHEDQFVQEFLYAVCDNLIYSYDAVNDQWQVLGAG